VGEVRQHGHRDAEHHLERLRRRVAGDEEDGERRRIGLPEVGHQALLGGL